MTFSETFFLNKDASSKTSEYRGGTKKSISHSNMQNMMPIFYLGVNWMCWIKISHALSHRTRSEASRTQIFTKSCYFLLRNSAPKRRFWGSPWNSNFDLHTHSGSFPRVINRMMRSCYGLLSVKKHMYRKIHFSRFFMSQPMRKSPKSS